VGVEPGDGAGDAVAIVGGLGEVMAFVLVDDERGLDALRFERMPEFVGLTSGIRRRCRQLKRALAF